MEVDVIIHYCGQQHCKEFTSFPSVKLKLLLHEGMRSWGTVLVILSSWWTESLVSNQLLYLPMYKSTPPPPHNVGAKK